MTSTEEPVVTADSGDTGTAGGAGGDTASDGKHAEGPPAPAVASTPDEVLEYWFGSSRPPADCPENEAMWWKGGADVDADIKARFGPLVEAALAPLADTSAPDVGVPVAGRRSGLAEWEAEPYSCLAKIILLDQCTRNMYRKQARAFLGDAEAVRLTRLVLDKGWDTAEGADPPFCAVASHFALLPLLHSEEVALHDEYAALLAAHRHAGSHMLTKAAPFAKAHADVVRRFGRYPHRCEVLGRETTEEEKAYLADAERWGQ